MKTHHEIITHDITDVDGVGSSTRLDPAAGMVSACGMRSRLEACLPVDDESVACPLRLDSAWPTGTVSHTSLGRQQREEYMQSDPCSKTTARKLSQHFCRNKEKARERLI
jgi:hypothetical protein